MVTLARAAALAGFAETMHALGGDADKALRQRLFACRVEFDAELNGTDCKASDLNKPNPLADRAGALRPDANGHPDQRPRCQPRPAGAPRHLPAAVLGPR